MYRLLLCMGALAYNPIKDLCLDTDQCPGLRVFQEVTGIRVFGPGWCTGSVREGVRFRVGGGRVGD